jgi:hypothetical protein
MLLFLPDISSTLVLSSFVVSVYIHGKVLQYNKMNKPEMIKKLQETKIEMNNDHQNMTVDEVWDIFKNKVLGTVDQTVPSKMINNNKKRLLWITKEIKALTRTLVLSSFVVSVYIHGISL